MKFFRLAIFSLVTVICAAPGSAAEPSKVGDFALLDQNGKFHQLSWYGDAKAVVVFVQGNGCPIVRNGVHALKALRDEFESRGVVFFMLNPQMQDDRASIVKEAADFGYDFPILLDKAQLVAESLGVDRTAEAFVIDPETLTVLFRGPVDDRLDYESQKPAAKHHYLKDALEATLSGQAVAGDTPASPGCIINFSSKKQHREAGVSYSKAPRTAARRETVGHVANCCLRCKESWSSQCHSPPRAAI